MQTFFSKQKILCVHIQKKNQKLKESILLSHRNQFLGPLLFILYVIETEKSNSPQQVSKMLLYADDTVIKTTSSLKSLKADHKDILKETFNWLASKKLTPKKEQKTKFFDEKHQMLNIQQIQLLIAKKENSKI